jgi:ABC-type glycerol-3-phosphate transport system substrate-binding protein
MRKTAEKRTLCVILAIAFSVFMVCEAFAGGSKEENKPKAGQVNLRWFQTAATSSEIDQWRELAADVTKKFPHITVTLETIDWNNYWTKLPAQIAAGNTQDILYMQNLRTKGFVTKGCIPLDDYVKADKSLNFNDFVKGIIDGLSVDGNLYGLPYDVGPYLLFYNADLFDKYGIPYPDENMDLDSFVERAKRLTRDGNYGFAVSIHWDRWVPFIWGNGGEFNDDAGKYYVTKPEVVEAIKFYAGLIRDLKVAHPIADTGNQYQDREYFYSGKVGMYVDGPWNITNIKKFSKFKFGVAPFPIGMKGTRVTPTMGSGFTVSKFTKHPKEAYQAITALTSKESLEKLAIWGRALPARISAQPAFYQGNSEVLGLVKAMELSSKPGVSRTYSMPANWQEAYVTLLNNLTQPVLLGIKSPEAAAEETQKLLDALR